VRFYGLLAVALVRAYLGGLDVLCGKSSVVHEEKVYVARVVDEEGLMAGGHEMACLLVGAVTNL